MVTVDKYIRKLLFEHDCVIIPEFGGLLTHQREAHYDTSQAVFLPSSKRIAFNEVLKLDDGLLTYYISVNERISREEALSLVKKYVDSLRQTLKEGKTVTLDTIGSFSANSEGKPVFEPDYTQNFNNDWYGLEALHVACYSESGAEQVVEAELVTESENIEEETEILPLQKGILQTTWIRWAAAAIVAGAVFTMSIIYKPVDNSVLSTLNPFYGISDLYVATISRLPQISKNEEPAETVKTVEQLPVTASLPEPVPSEMSVPVATEMKEVTDNKEELNNVNQFTAGQPTVSGDYFLIAGSFGKMKNAQQLRDILLREGFKQAEILDAHSGKLIKVSVGAYQSMNKALVDKDKVDQITSAESWVYHKK